MGVYSTMFIEDIFTIEIAFIIKCKRTMFLISYEISSCIMVLRTYKSYVTDVQILCYGRTNLMLRTYKSYVTDVQL